MGPMLRTAQCHIAAVALAIAILVLADGPLLAVGDTAHVSDRDELRAALNDASVDVIVVIADIDDVLYQNPINRNITITGQCGGNGAGFGGLCRIRPRANVGRNSGSQLFEAATGTSFTVRSLEVYDSGHMTCKGDGGGFILNKNSDATFEDVRFDTARVGAGGAVFASTSNLTFKRCTFVNMVANNFCTVRKARNGTSERDCVPP